MTTHYVATLSRYVVVETENEERGPRLGLDALVALFADLRLQPRQNVPIGIRTVRLAAEEEITFCQWHRESVAAERSNAKFHIDMADDLMCILDQDNKGYDNCHVLAGPGRRLPT